MFFSDWPGGGRGPRRHGGIGGASEHARRRTRRDTRRISRGCAVSPTCARIGVLGLPIPELLSRKNGPRRHDRKIHAAGGSGVFACWRLHASPVGAKERPVTRGVGAVSRCPARVARDAILVLLPERVCFACRDRRGSRRFLQSGRSALACHSFKVFSSSA